MKWISIKDKIPELKTLDEYDKSSSRVLVYDEEEEIVVGKLFVYGASPSRNFDIFSWEACLDEKRFHHAKWLDLKRVTHWMPLPKKPNETH